MTQSSPTRPNPLPIRSMTGFARTAGTLANGDAFILTLKSVNHRFLDLQFHLPNGMETFEMQTRRMMKERFSRGHVEVRVTVRRQEAAATGVDRIMVARYIEAFRALAAENNLPGEPDLNAALRLPGVWASGAAEFPEESESLSAALTQALPEAIRALNAMREQEGAALAQELRQTLARMSTHVDALSALRAGVQQAQLARLQATMRELLAAAPADPQRLLQEAALMADRTDIEEELARMRGHIEHFRSMLDAGGDCGKRLDFLLQEMTREANTSLSKTGGVAGRSLQMTELGLAMKSEIEKAREQVQNLE